MILKLIEGEFNRIETMNMITQMFEVRIKFHENKILSLHNEEDIKMREKKIKFLQNELAQAKTYIANKEEPIAISCEINL